MPQESWQDRYAQWRDCREEVVVWGPAEGSSITTTTYYVKAIATERCFYTDDVVIPADDGMNAAVDAGPGEKFCHISLNVLVAKLNLFSVMECQHED